MAFFQCDFFSETLQLSCSLNAIIPQRIGQASTDEREQERFPTLYLLHGLSFDHTSWMRRTSIERYALKAGLAVIMPAANRSFYANMYRGPKYWDYISEEIPRIAEQFFPLSREPKDRFVAGNSMGGYGAFKLAFTYPERFAAAASLSGALCLDDDEESLRERVPEWNNLFESVSSFVGSENDLLHLISVSANEKRKLPRLYQCCGTEDFLYPANQIFLSTARKKGIEIHYEESPIGHEWAYWDSQIQGVIDWLPLEGDPEAVYF